MHDPAHAAPAPSRQPVEELMANAKLTPFMAAALMAHSGWGQGRELTQAEFDDALAEVKALSFGYRR